jgi:hypothetical protein
LPAMLWIGLLLNVPVLKFWTALVTLIFGKRCWWQRTKSYDICHYLFFRSGCQCRCLAPR